MKEKLHIFNPTCDMAVLKRNPYFTPSELLCDFENELSYLMAFCSNKGDAVLVKNIPTKSYLNFLEKVLGFMPQFVETKSVLFSEFELLPWGWSPVIFRLQQREWNDSYMRLFSRYTGFKFGHDITVSNLHALNYNCVKISTLTELKQILFDWKKIVVKAPWSSSGRGVVFLNDEKDTASMQWIEGFLNSQKEIFVEPAYTKKQDVSFIFYISKEGVRFEGITYFFTSDRKQYDSHIIGNVRKAYNQKKVNSVLTNDFVEELVHVYTDGLNKCDFLDYRGYIGIDAMIIDVDGQERFMPFCEINIRTTMGLVALKLSKLLSNNVFGKMYIRRERNAFKNQEIRAKQNPLRLNNSFIESGTFSLIPLNHSNKFNAWVEI